MRLELITTGFDDPPALDTAVSRVILQQVAAGLRPPTFRLHRPPDVVAFGRQDAAQPGYAAAVSAARAAGFGAIERLAGGRAAVFHDETLAFSWAVPAPDPRSSVTDRFESITSLLCETFRLVGLDARSGEVPGEYCPGSYSINVGGRSKIAGVGQRLIAGGAHVGGVIVCDGHDRINTVLDPVYAALGLSFDRDATGSVRRHVDVAPARVATALIEVLSARYILQERALDAGTLAEARSVAGQHLAQPA